MKRENIILDIVGAGLSGHGFTYVPNKKKLSWDFKRKVGTISQWITVEEEHFIWHPNNPKALHLYFVTDAYKSRPWSAVQMIPSERLPEPDEITKLVHAGAMVNGRPAFNSNDECKGAYWSFKTEEEYKNILKEFVSIIEDYGLAKFKNLSVEENQGDIIPTDEMGARLFSSIQTLNEEFISTYQLDPSDYSRENISKWFEVIDQVITESNDTPYDKVQDLLIKITAFLGEQLRKELGGEWSKGIKDRIIVIHDMNTRNFSGYFPLDNVVDSWKNKSIKKLKGEFLYLLDGKKVDSSQLN